MDAPLPDPYVRGHPMLNLLLLISAMLSALVGAGSSARVVGMPAAVAEGSAQARATILPARAITTRPVPAPVALVAVRGLLAAIMVFLPTRIPAWANRRRE